MKKIGYYLGLLAVSLVSLIYCKPQIVKKSQANRSETESKVIEIADAHLNCGGDGGVT